MKIRTDFVTNSSSSSFTASVGLYDVNGNEIVFRSPSQDFTDVNNEYFDINPNLLDLKNLNTLLSILTDSIHSWVLDSYEDFDDDGKSYKNYLKNVKNNKKMFISDSKKQIHNISDISKIVFNRSYFAYGDGKDCIVENDTELNELADEYVQAKGKKKDKAKKKLIEYLNESNTDRCCGSFGEGFDEFRYNWSKDPSDIDALAEAIVNRELDDSESGREITEVDFKSKSIRSYAELDLKFEKETIGDNTQDDNDWENDYYAAKKHLIKEWESLSDEFLIKFECEGLIDYSEKQLDRAVLAERWLGQYRGIEAPIENDNQVEIKNDNNEFEIEDRRMIRYLKNEQEVFIPNGVVTIEDTAFGGHWKLYSTLWDRTSPKIIHIPATVERIRPDSFYIMPDLIEIIVDNNSKFFSSLDGVLYTKDMTELIKYPDNKPEHSFVIPETVLKINPEVFCENKNLKRIIFRGGDYSIKEFNWWLCDTFSILKTGEIICKGDPLSLRQPDRFEGLTFSAAGKFNIFKNNKEFKDYVEKHGGSVSNSVSKSTSYLINNDNESSEKYWKAEELGIRIISEDDFVEMFGPKNITDR